MSSLKKIFKMYDIRGLVGSEMTWDGVKAIGAGFADELELAGKSLVVGHDMRDSSVEFVEAFIEGANARGADAINLGLCSTDECYFASGHLGAAAAMFTASHNPATYNGIKLSRAGARGISMDTGLSAILARAEKYLATGVGEVDEPGFSSEHEIMGEYASYLRHLVDLSAIRPLKIVIDAANGMGGLTAPSVLGNDTLLPELPLEIVPLYFELDGSFPNHEANPLDPKNLVDLQKAVLQHKADVGLAFDGDGDRLGIVTQDGETIYPDRQMQLFAQDVLSRVPGGTILFDVKCSQRLAPAIRAAGGQALMFKTGHSLIKAKMKQIEADGGQAPLGGEMSGHIFFKERWYGFDDGTYAGCRLLEILSRSPNANAVLKALPTSFSTPELNVLCKEGEPHVLTAQLLKVASQHFVSPAEISDIDGLRVDWPDGFGLIRASNTTPVLVLRFEGHTESALHRIEHDMLTLLKTVKPDASLQSASH